MNKTCASFNHMKSFKSSIYKMIVLLEHTVKIFKMTVVLELINKFPGILLALSLMLIGIHYPLAQSEGT